jgi:hypothetical protein
MASWLIDQVTMAHTLHRITSTVNPANVTVSGAPLERLPTGSAGQQEAARLPGAESHLESAPPAPDTLPSAAPEAWAVW